MNKYLSFALLPMLFSLAFLILSCSDASINSETSIKTIDQVPQKKWTALSKKSLFFGHQSVGFNIVEGIQFFIADHPQLKLDFIETRQVDKVKAGVFAHTQIGENQAPLKKIKDFVDLMDSGIGNKVDFAFFKFCYVDITADTGIEELFKAYKSNMAQLKAKYPRTTFIHYTVPLTTVPVTWKTKLKKLFGIELWEYRNTLARNAYNKLILNEYQGKEPVFDLAAIESTRPDGEREYIELDKQKYYTLATAYTSDGGHLNQSGKKIVADQFMLFLANLI